MNHQDKVEQRTSGFRLYHGVLDIKRKLDGFENRPGLERFGRLQGIVKLLKVLNKNQTQAQGPNSDAPYQRILEEERAGEGIKKRTKMMRFEERKRRESCESSLTMWPTDGKRYFSISDWIFNDFCLLSSLSIASSSQTTNSSKCRALQVSVFFCFSAETMASSKLGLQRSTACQIASDALLALSDR